MRNLTPAVLLSFLAAVLIAVLFRPAPLEQQFLRLQVAQALPGYSDALRDESAEIQALVLSYASDPVLVAKARLALLRYPAMARRILVMYGDDPAFQHVLRTYGEDVVLPIHYFLENEVLTVAIMRGFSDTARSAMDAVRGLWHGGATEGQSAGQADTSPEGEPSGTADAASQGESVEGATRQPLSSEERGEYAIQFIQAEGYDFLGQFVIAPDGNVGWVQTERVLEGINQLFAGGLKGLETRLRRDEKVEAADIGWAAMDVAIGVGAFKVLRMGRGTAAGGRSLTFSERSAVLGAGLWRGSVAGARAARYGAPIVLAYMAVRHPSLINSLLGSAAERLGLPVALVQVVGWTLVLLPVMLLLRFVAAPLAWLLSRLAGVLRYCAGRPAFRKGTF